MTAPQPLAGGFAAVTEADWRAAVSRSTSRSDGDLAAASDDGIPIGPIYRRAAGATPVIARPPGRKWRIVQRVAAPDAQKALALCREDLAGGADGILLSFAESLHPLTSPMPAETAAAIAGGLKGMPDAALIIDAGPRTADVAAAFADLTPRDLAFDPIAAVATGRLATADATMARLAALAKTVAGGLALADGRIWHAAGASEVQELAVVLATVVAQLRLFDAAGLAPDAAAKRIGVMLAADTDQFLTIAKFRALRLLAARALEAAGIAAMPPVHAETAWRTMSRREPRMNALRATGAAFAAAVGGADSITVLPFDALDGGGSAEARRLARNTQLVIAEECQIFRFADPAAGAGAVEQLTDALTERAWARFQAIEADGGMLAALAGGTLQQEIVATRQARLARMAAGGIEMVGVNVFVNRDEAPLPGQADSGATEGALAFQRLAEAMEAAP